MSDSRGCQCGGFTSRDISPWCEIHATKETLTEDERLDAIEKLKRSLDYTQNRLDSLECATDAI